MSPRVRDLLTSFEQLSADEQELATAAILLRFDSLESESMTDDDVTRSADGFFVAMDRAKP